MTPEITPDMTPAPGDIYSIGEDRIMIVDSTETEVSFIYSNEVKTVDLSSFKHVATRIL